MLSLGHIFNKYKVSFHCYADDTQLYLKLDSTLRSSLPDTFQVCLKEIKAWMKSNKTETIIIGTPHQTLSHSFNCIPVLNHIPLSNSVTNLGIRFDPHLSFDPHNRHLCKASFFHLKGISKLRPPSHNQMLRGCSMPLSPPGWTIAMPSSSGFLARAIKNSNTFRTVLPGS